ncbi:hypothetical protein CAI16_06895 [Virgibacillus dokdonensis]|uniref:Uncharacterized protein n=1 Tax=Virgibacillus dokdonensis TaxID=302167 RepID=A0A3E0WSE9_9BACI|nr:hypothetical protein CAI16_06895 [Virgibacillus dokdonensis]
MLIIEQLTIKYIGFGKKILNITCKFSIIGNLIMVTKSFLKLFTWFLTKKFQINKRCELRGDKSFIIVKNELDKYLFEVCHTFVIAFPSFLYENSL